MEIKEDQIPDHILEELLQRKNSLSLKLHEFLNNQEEQNMAVIENCLRQFLIEIHSQGGLSMQDSKTMISETIDAIYAVDLNMQQGNEETNEL
jgi:hypothetical protein